jgi:3-isopropylmalate/(R)-2-methylmalate dehydratase small subunit
MRMIDIRNVRARVVGDHVNTDYIISSRRKRDSLDPKVLSQYLMEDLDPSFAATVKPGDILVAGENFGCGSAMEVAATVVIGAGIPAVIAPSFSRTYYRNAVNNGLLPLVADTRSIREGEILSIVTLQGQLRILRHATHEAIEAAPFPPIMAAILAEGGLIPYFAKHGRFAL